MFTIFALIFLTLMIGIGAWLVFIWATKTGQFDDPEAPKYRMMEDDETTSEGEAGFEKMKNETNGRH